MNLTIFEQSFLAHLAGDWILQNEWMAKNKTSLLHPAAWVHAAIHGVLLGLILGWAGGLVLGTVHMLIDTRIPLLWWQRTFRQSSEGNPGYQTQVWADQVLHLITIALWIAFV
jgi:hypothetical protein